jgi:hypothetical protein
MFTWAGQTPLPLHAAGAIATAFGAVPEHEPARQEVPAARFALHAPAWQVCR